MPKIIKCSTIGPRARAGQEAQRADDDDDPDQPDDEERRVRGQRARAGRHLLLARQRAGDRQGRDGQPVAGEEHDDAEGGVIERRVRAQPGEGAAVVARGRGKGIQDFAEAVRAGVEDRGLARRRHDRRWQCRPAR